MNKRRLLLIAAALLTITVGGYFLFYYDNGKPSTTTDDDAVTSDSMDAADREIQQRRERLLKEQGHPADFITITIDPKKNLFGESVIEGNLENEATETAYKDFELMIYWQDEVGAVMDSAAEVVFEGLDPGESVDFRTKRMGPRKSRAIQVKLRSAQVVGG